MTRVKSDKPKKGFLDGYKTYDDSRGRGNIHKWRAAWEDMTGEEAAAVCGNDDPLSIMGFTSFPTMAELAKRFGELMRVNHPDMGGDLKTAQKITGAFTILKDKINA